MDVSDDSDFRLVSGAGLTPALLPAVLLPPAVAAGVADFPAPAPVPAAAAAAAALPAPPPDNDAARAATSPVAAAPCAAPAVPDAGLCGGGPGGFRFPANTEDTGPDSDAAAVFPSPPSSAGLGGHVNVFEPRFAADDDGEAGVAGVAALALSPSELGLLAVALDEFARSSHVADSFRGAAAEARVLLAAGVAAAAALLPLFVLRPAGELVDEARLGDSGLDTDADAAAVVAVAAVDGAVTAVVGVVTGSGDADADVVDAGVGDADDDLALNGATDGLPGFAAAPVVVVVVAPVASLALPVAAGDAGDDVAFTDDAPAAAAATRAAIGGVAAGLIVGVGAGDATDTAMEALGRGGLGGFTGAAATRDAAPGGGGGPAGAGGFLTDPVAAASPTAAAAGGAGLDGGGGFFPALAGEGTAAAAAAAAVVFGRGGGCTGCATTPLGPAPRASMGLLCSATDPSVPGGEPARDAAAVPATSGFPPGRAMTTGLPAGGAIFGGPVTALTAARADLRMEDGRRGLGGSLPLLLALGDVDGDAGRDLDENRPREAAGTTPTAGVLLGVAAGLPTGDDVGTGDGDVGDDDGDGDAASDATRPALDERLARTRGLVGPGAAVPLPPAEDADADAERRRGAAVPPAAVAPVAAAGGDDPVDHFRAGAALVADGVGVGVDVGVGDGDRPMDHFRAGVAVAAAAGAVAVDVDGAVVGTAHLSMRPPRPATTNPPAHPPAHPHYTTSVGSGVCRR